MCQSLTINNNKNPDRTLYGPFAFKSSIKAHNSQKIEQ